MDVKTYLITKKEDIRNIKVKPRLRDVDINKNLVMSVVGPRRAGKTFFLYHLIRKLGLSDENFLFVNFEDYVDYKNPFEFLVVHQEIYGKEPEYLFFDEIQALDRWEKFIYSLFEKKRYYIFITGSSSKLLSKEVATQLRGRTSQVKIYPLSFQEIFFYESIGKRKGYSIYEEGRIKHFVNKYLFSLYPDIFFNNVNPREFFKNYLDLVTYKDVIERFGIKNRFALELFIKSALSSFTKEFSVHKLFNTLKSQGTKISKKTLYSFQKMLEDVQVFLFLRKYSKSMRKTELSIPKAHLVDPGLYNFLVEEDVGKTMENIVFLELIKKGFELNKNLFYFKTGGNKEIDILVKENDRVKQLINVTYISSFDEIDRREYVSLLEGYYEFKQYRPELIIITWDYEDEKTLKWFGKEGRIKFVPLWKWLLSL